jgi:membrane-bound metal-dependent hydrolase YbcI (DUF457 family)
VASPIAHSFAGLWTFLLLPRQARSWLVTGRSVWFVRLALLVFLANLPDLDFFLALGQHANELHRGFTHSLAAALALSLGLSCLWRIAPGFWRSASLYFMAYGSHLLIDLSTGRRLGWTHSGYGIPLFWPSHQQVNSPLIILFGVRHNNLSALFSIDNLWFAAYELALCGAITLILLTLWRRKLQPQMYQPNSPAAKEPRPIELQCH